MAILVSYHGPYRADVDFSEAAEKLVSEWRTAVNKAVNSGRPEPPKPMGFRGDTLYLIPGTTVSVTPEEIALIHEQRPDLTRFLQVHVPKEIRSLKPKSESKVKLSVSEPPPVSESGKPQKKRVG